MNIITIYCHLSYEERKNIEDGLNNNKSIYQISKEIKRSHSTILREIDRNKTISTSSNWNNYNIPCKNRNICNKNFCDCSLKCLQKENDCFLTLLWKKSKFMLIFKLENQTTDEVTRIFKYLL